MDPEPNLSAFDAVAAEYDQFDANIVVPHLRAKLIGTCLRHFKSATRILELNSGTCTDAIALARHGFQIIATDASPGMLSVGRGKIAASGLEVQIQVENSSFSRIGALEFNPPIHGVFSNFGGLNCADDLNQVLKDAVRTLSAGDPVILCILNKFCIWEFMRYLLRGQAGKAFRRFSSSPVRAHIGNGATVMVRYYSPRQVILMISEYLIPTEIYSISVFSPLPNSTTFMRNHPALTSIMLKIDDAIERLPLFRSVGDHFVLVARKK
jgi:ubiquinone/menaquinone biosynthesis C-methylase UbiE